LSITDVPTNSLCKKCGHYKNKWTKDCSLGIELNDNCPAFQALKPYEPKIKIQRQGVKQ